MSTALVRILWTISISVVMILPAWAAPLVGDPALDRAGKEQVLALVREIEAIPAVNDSSRILFEDLPVYAAKRLKPYQPDQKVDTPLRQAVEQASKVLGKCRRSCPGEYRANNLMELKATVLQTQKGLATVDLEIAEALETLVEVREDRSRESRLWQARYDYVTARLLEHQAFLLEYQFMLSEIRTDSLPMPLKTTPGWQLLPRAQFQCKGAENREAKKRSEQARAILDRMTHEHAGTPWEFFARRESRLGLGWELLPPGK